MNDNNCTSTTPAFDATLAALAPCFVGTSRWTLEGWAGHIRGAKHQLHAINSLVKHAGEFDATLWPAAFILTIARCTDFGMDANDAAREIHQRRAVRAMKAVA